MYNTEAALNFRKHSFWLSSRIVALSACALVQQLRAPAAVMIGLRASPLYNEFHVASIFAAKVQIHPEEP